MPTAISRQLNPTRRPTPERTLVVGRARRSLFVGTSGVGFGLGAAAVEGVDAEVAAAKQVVSTSLERPETMSNNRARPAPRQAPPNRVCTTGSRVVRVAAAENLGVGRCGSDVKMVSTLSSSTRPDAAVAGGRG